MSSPEYPNPLDALEWLQGRRRDTPRERPSGSPVEWPDPILAEGVVHVWHEPMHDIDGVLAGFEEQRADLRVENHEG